MATSCHDLGRRAVKVRDGPALAPRRIARCLAAGAVPVNRSVGTRAVLRCARSRRIHAHPRVVCDPLRSWTADGPSRFECRFRLDPRIDTARVDGSAPSAVPALLLRPVSSPATQERRLAGPLPPECRAGRPSEVPPFPKNRVGRPRGCSQGNPEGKGQRYPCRGSTRRSALWPTGPARTAAPLRGTSRRSATPILSRHLNETHHAGRRPAR